MFADQKATILANPLAGYAMQQYIDRTEVGSIDAVAGIGWNTLQYLVHEGAQLCDANDGNRWCIAG